MRSFKIIHPKNSIIFIQNLWETSLHKQTPGYQQNPRSEYSIVCKIGFVVSISFVCPHQPCSWVHFYPHAPGFILSRLMPFVKLGSKAYQYISLLTSTHHNHPP